MDANLIDKISAPDFNAEKYVRELSQRWVGCIELRQQRKAVQALSENTNIQLKKNVYQNYTQFIETAKEITHLESEMYQLSHLLSDQKALLDAIYNSNIHSELDSVFPEKSNEGKKTEEERQNDEEEARRRKLTAILEKVEGCSGLLDVKGRSLIYEGDLIECDPVENTPLHKIHAYLFNDALMLTLWIKDRRGPTLYKVYKTYDIGTLAVINVRDVPAVKVAFKILTSSDTKLFTCSSAKAKKEWLECFDLTKKQKLASEKLKRDIISQSSVDIAPLAREASLSQTSIESHFEEKPAAPELPEWFLDSPEDLEVFIAERHFESALDLLARSKEFCKTFADPNDFAFVDIREKTEIQRKLLINVLVKELEVSPEKSLQGGLRAARRAVRLLNNMGRQTQACELMLQLCTSIMKKELKSVKREGSSTLYVERLGHQFYSTLLDVATEFTRVFESAHTCIAALAVWTHAQLAQFINHVVKQVFVPQASLSTIADCVASLRTQNSQLSDCGMDLRYEMDGILLKPVTVALRDAKEKCVEALRLRSADDKCRPMNLNNKASLLKLLHELRDLGVQVPSAFIKGDCWLELTSNTVAFIRMELSLIEDCCKLHSQQLHHVIEEIIYETIKFQLRLTDSSLHSQNLDSNQVETQYKNATFLIDNLLPYIEVIFEANFKIVSTKLASLAQEYSHMKTPGGKPKPAPRQAVPKYTSEEFI